MTHKVITDPFEMGYNEEQILKVSQIFIQYCKAFKISINSPTYKDPEFRPNYKNWEQAVGEARLLSLTSKDLPQNTSKYSNLHQGDKNLLGGFVTEMEDILAGEVYKTASNSGMFYYPPTGFMSWHTNAAAPCDRLYITYSDTGGSFFRYYDNESKEIITDYDRAGLSWRLFPVTNEPPHFWHCVGSDCERISCGFRLNDPRDPKKWPNRPNK